MGCAEDGGLWGATSAAVPTQLKLASGQDLANMAYALAGDWGGVQAGSSGVCVWGWGAVGSYIGSSTSAIKAGEWTGPCKYCIRFCR